MNISEQRIESLLRLAGMYIAAHEFTFSTAEFFSFDSQGGFKIDYSKNIANGDVTETLCLLRRCFVNHYNNAYERYILSNDNYSIFAADLAFDRVTHRIIEFVQSTLLVSEDLISYHEKELPAPF